MNTQLKELEAFVETMKNKIDSKAHLYGKDDYTVSQARNHLILEIQEWLKAWESDNRSNEKKELIDIANVAYFVWRRL